MVLGFAIVGAGQFAAARIVPALVRAADCTPVAVVSRDRMRGERFAEEYGLPTAYDDLGAALADPHIDAVWVATPHALHREVVERAAAARKHVLCEKPLATTVEDARAIVATCRRAGVSLGTGFHLRHHPLHREAHRLVASGEMGTVLHAEGEWSLESPGGTAAPWRTDATLAGGGIVTGTGVHVIDLLRFVLGDEVAAVSAVTDTDRSPIAPLETRAVALLRFAHGATATVRCLRPVRAPINGLIVQGTTASLATTNTIDEAARGRLAVVGAESDLVGIPAGTDMYTRQAHAFARAAINGDEPSASGRDGLAVAEITAALYESARRGREVRVEEMR